VQFTGSFASESWKPDGTTGISWLREFAQRRRTARRRPGTRLT
jgi:hypothetical protein